MRQVDMRPFIGGHHVDSHSDATVASIDPATEELLWTLPTGDPADIDLAVMAARQAFGASGWARDAALRTDTLLRLADLIEEHAEELAVLDTTEVGIPIGITTGDAAMVASSALFPTSLPTPKPRPAGCLAVWWGCSARGTSRCSSRSPSRCRRWRLATAWC
jgi:hypothetical protein